MQAVASPNSSSRTAMLGFKMSLLLGGLMMVGGGIWYVAITGIVGSKKWISCSTVLARRFSRPQAPW